MARPPRTPQASASSQCPHHRGTRRSNRVRRRRAKRLRILQRTRLDAQRTEE
jgi:hypothetical protein